MTPSERLTRLDREVEDLKQAFLDAGQQLEETPEVDGSYDERWAQIGRRLRDLRADLLPSDYDKDQVAILFATLFDIRDLLDEEQNLDTIDELVLATERVRHVIRDALDEHVAGVSDDVGLVVNEIIRFLPSVTRARIAKLVGVDRRTLARWAKQSGTPSRRLKIVARLVAILRHNWTQDGTVAWFYRGRRDFDGRAPIDLLASDNFDEEALLAAARAGRSMYAS
jgi:hypothetical protein